MLSILDRSKNLLSGKELTLYKDVFLQAVSLFTAMSKSLTHGGNRNLLHLQNFNQTTLLQLFNCSFLFARLTKNY